MVYSTTLQLYYDTVCKLRSPPEERPPEHKLGTLLLQLLFTLSIQLTLSGLTPTTL